MEEEMDSIESDHNDDCIIGDTSPGSPDMDDIFGDPQILPRVGDQYQVSVPSLVTRSDGLPIIQSSTNEEVTVDTADSFLMGLPIPIMWVHDRTEKTVLEGKSIKHEGHECRRDSDDEADTNETAKSENNKVSPINADTISSKVKGEALDVDYEKASRKSPNGEAVVGNQMEVDLPSEQHEKYNMYQKSNGKGLYPAPGLLGNSWSNIELESFLLGLYIFGKNLVQVKRFTESKEMGDILSYYYGKFYRSDGHRRWSECRKIRSRKCIHGQRIFTGWRQQELLSRLRPRVLEEGHSSLLEVSKAFGEGKITLEDYVFSLKATVGTQTLIEAIGIGKGKQDLTGIMDPIKTNQVNSTRQEIPSGKDCNSLTSEDIVKFLTGDFRLSKARSNDLFWEAVWPRLLARGWRSEQPKSQRYAGAKNSLVFLIPGVKKFSRRRLTKGNQYFDSVADVLNKVASDPKLLDVEVETPRGSGSKEKHGCDTERKLEQNGPSDHQRHCYLKPRVSNCTPEIMKFTVVDTSLVHEEGPFKIRELRNLPVGANTRTRLSREAAVASSEEPMDKPDILLNHQEDTNGSRPTKDILDRVMFTESLDCPVSVLKNCMPINGQGNTNSLIENHEGQSTDVCDDQSVRKTLKYQSRQRAKRGQLNGLAPVMKRRRLTACVRADANRITNNVPADSRVKEEPCSLVESPDVSDNLDSAVGPSQEKVSTSSSAKASPDESSEDILAESCVGRVPCHVKAEPRTLIDLNLPHVPLDFEAGTEVVDSPDDQSAKGSSYPSETIQPDDSQSLRTANEIASEEEQPTVNARRQSTRNRPLTTKALEALACGYLNTKRKWRGAEPMTRENSLARPSRRVRRRVGKPTSLGDVVTKITDSKVDEGVEEVCSSNTSMQTKSLVPTERTRTHELKPIYHSELLAGKNNRPR